MILTKKHPSAEVKPANQLGSLNLKSKILGLVTGIVFGKASLLAKEIPQFIEALIATIFRKPSRLKCSLFLIKIKALLNRR